MYSQHNKTGVWNKIFTIPRSVLSIPDFPIKLSSSLSIASGRRKEEEERRSGPRGHTTGAEAPFLSICRWLFVCLRWFPRYYGRRCHERANRDVKEKKEAPCFPLYISDNFFGIHMHEMVWFLRGKWRRFLLLFLNFFFFRMARRVMWESAFQCEWHIWSGWRKERRRMAILLPSLSFKPTAPKARNSFLQRGGGECHYKPFLPPPSFLFAIFFFTSLRNRQRGLQNVKSKRSLPACFKMQVACRRSP